MTDNIHREHPVRTAGDPIEQAQAAMILLHGRGGTADDVLALSRQFARPSLAFLAPQASGNTWYPNSFLAPIASNEPWLSGALSMVDDLLADLSGQGLEPGRVVLLGFSQGACLALEYAARHARRYGGLVGLSGGLIGPEGTPREYPGSLDGTPVFLGCSDNDVHIPAVRVRHTADILEALGGQVLMRLYPGMGHTINADELQKVRSILDRLMAQPD